jgi:hypothetical protein
MRKPGIKGIQKSNYFCLSACPEFTKDVEGSCCYWTRMRAEAGNKGMVAEDDLV